MLKNLFEELLQKDEWYTAEEPVDLNSKMHAVNDQDVRLIIEV